MDCKIIFLSLLNFLFTGLWCHKDYGPHILNIQLFFCIAACRKNLMSELKKRICDAARISDTLSGLVHTPAAGVRSDGNQRSLVGRRFSKVTL